MNYFKHILSILFCVLAFNVQAQETPAQIGNRLFNLNRFADAIPFYKQELETLKDPKLFQDVTFRLAECYRILGKNEEAEKAYKIMFLKNRKSPGVLYNYAIFLKGLGKYSDAKQKFANYETMFPEDTLTKWQIASCDSAIAWLKSSSGYYVREVKEVNSAEPEFSPLLLNNTLHFVSSKASAAELTGQTTGGNEDEGNARKTSTPKGKKVQPDKNALDAPLPTLDIFTTLITDTTVKAATPMLMTGFGQSLHEGPAAVNAKGDEIFITRPSDNGTKDRSRNLVENRLIIVSSKKEATGQWSALKDDLPFNKPEEFSVGHPAISPDGKLLVFMSDKPGGFGGTDLYLSLRNGETWGESVNLGPQINTPGYEMFPYFRDDGTFYFSSNMHPGMGGLDIFSVKYDSASSSWGKVINMRPPVNSSYDDFGITFVKGSDKGFFSSKRPEGTGDDDIYSFIGNKEIQVTYDGDEFRIRNEFFYDQLTYAVKDLETGKETMVAGNTPELKLKLSPNKKYELRSMRGKQTVNTLTLSYGLSPEGAFNLAFSSDSLPVNIKGYIRSSDATGTAQSILNAAKNSVGLPGVDIKINNSKNELVQEAVTDSSGKFNFKKTFSPKENYALALSDQKAVSFSQPVTAKETVTDKPDSLIAFKGRAVRLGTAAPVTGVKISLFKGTQEITKVTNDKDGRILFNLSRGETYTVVGSKDGFFQCQVKVSTINKPNISAIEEVLAMEPIKRDTSINLIDIYYDFAKATLRSESKKVLMRMYQFLKDNDSIAIELMAHTDEVGTDASNMVLSQKRAQSVVDFLIEKGVSPQRMLAVGYGESTPKVPNAHNAKDHQLNRRTEFRIVSKSDIPKLMAVHKRKIAEYESTFRNEQQLEASKPAEKSMFTVSPNLGSGKIDGIVQAKPEQGIVYKVQIASSETEVPPDYFSGFKRVETLRDAKGIHKYFGASTTSYDEALAMLNKIRSENKIGDAFVVPYKDGKRIEFDEIEGWGTKRFTTPVSQSSHMTTNEPVNGYVVQIAALRTKDKLPDFKGVDVKEKKGEDGFYRYYVGPFASMEQANAERQRLINLGFSGAFIRSGL